MMDMIIEEKNRMISQQDVQIAAIQSEFDIVYGEESRIKDMDYNALVCCGMNPEMVEQQVNEEERSRRHR